MNGKKITWETVDGKLRDALCMYRVVTHNDEYIYLDLMTKIVILRAFANA
jgi:hypothetical protein